MAGVQGEEIALAIREHQTRVEDWRYARLAGMLHRWVEVFDSEFKLQLPSYPIIRFAPLRNAYASYQAARGELGTKDNITFNSREIWRDATETLATLCHELLHLWQEYHGRPARSNYHNAEFRKKALDCGLVVDTGGCHSGYTEKFAAVLARYGIQLEPWGEVEPVRNEARLYGAGRYQLKMKKWWCGCTNVRCATRLYATCNRCGGTFFLVEPPR